MGLVSVTFRKLWPEVAGPGGLAPARSNPDPGPSRARPPPPSLGLEAGLPGRSEALPSQARAPGSAAAAAAIPARAAGALAGGESRLRAASESARHLRPEVRAGLPTAPAATAQAR